MTNFSFLANEEKIPNICVPTALSLQYNIKTHILEHLHPSSAIDWL